MKPLHVFIEIGGSQKHVGQIAGDDVNSAVFSYDEAYLMDGLPVSVSLPLQKDAFTPSQTRFFFDGLLPEGFTRRSVAQWLHAEESDYLSILAGLGKECLGAIRISEEKEVERSLMEAGYRKLTMEQVRELAAEGASASTELIVGSHLSLTGASGKVGLYFDDQEGAWYQPVGTAASTHIVKQSHVRLNNIIGNEQMILRTAALLGIPVAGSRIVSTGGFGDDEILLATRRYDRILSKGSKIGGLSRPLRLHQEDFAQALGISSAEKYESGSAGYLKKIFRLLRENSADPLKDQLQLLDLLIFDSLIGNTDNHIKNLSLLYSQDLKTVRMAPAYDLVCTAVYKASTAEMSISIAGEKDWRRIQKESFCEASTEIGIAPSVISKEYERLKSGLESAIRTAAGELEAQGMTSCRTLSEQILSILSENGKI